MPQLPEALPTQESPFFDLIGDVPPLHQKIVTELTATNRHCIDEELAYVQTVRLMGSINGSCIQRLQLGRYTAQQIGGYIAEALDRYCPPEFTTDTPSRKLSRYVADMLVDSSIASIEEETNGRYTYEDVIRHLARWGGQNLHSVYTKLHADKTAAGSREYSAYHRFMALLQESMYIYHTFDPELRLDPAVSVDMYRVALTIAIRSKIHTPNEHPADYALLAHTFGICEFPITQFSDCLWPDRHGVQDFLNHVDNIERMAKLRDAYEEACPEVRDALCNLRMLPTLMTYDAYVRAVFGINPLERRYSLNRLAKALKFPETRLRDKTLAIFRGISEDNPQWLIGRVSVMKQRGVSPQLRLYTDGTRTGKRSGTDEADILRSRRHLEAEICNLSTGGGGMPAGEVQGRLRIFKAYYDLLGKMSIQRQRAPRAMAAEEIRCAEIALLAHEAKSHGSVYDPYVLQTFPPTDYGLKVASFRRVMEMWAGLRLFNLADSNFGNCLRDRWMAAYLLEGERYKLEMRNVCQSLFDEDPETGEPFSLTRETSAQLLASPRTKVWRYTIASMARILLIEALLSGIDPNAEDKFDKRETIEGMFTPEVVRKCSLQGPAGSLPVSDPDFLKRARDAYFLTVARLPARGDGAYLLRDKILRSAVLSVAEGNDFHFTRFVLFGILAGYPVADILRSVCCIEGSPNYFPDSWGSMVNELVRYLLQPTSTYDRVSAQ